MLSSETDRPLDHGRAGLLARRVCWPALVLVLACGLDAWHPPSAAAGFSILWLDGAALTCLAWAMLARPRLRASDWRTPVDTRVLAAFALSALQIVAAPHEGPPVLWMRQILSCGVCYYALGARLRRDSGAPNAVWPAFAVAAFAIGAHALWSATQGIAHLAEASARADVGWASHRGLAKTLVLATVLCAGRACEANARPLWRTAALVGAIGCALHGFTGGIGLEAHEMARLDEPLYFSTTAVTLLILISFARLAWGLRRERPGEAPRWRAMAVGFAAVAVMAVLGGTTGGEGLRALAFLGGAAVVAAIEAPPPAMALAEPVTDPALAKAA